MKRAGVVLLCLGILSLIVTIVGGVMVGFIATSSSADVAFILSIIPFLEFASPFAGIGICAGVFLLVIASIRNIRGPRYNTAGFLLALGEVVEAKESGLVVNGSPRVKIKFFYAAQNGQLIHAEIQRILPYDAVNTLKPGSMIILRYDPKDTQKVVLETNAAPKELEKAKFTFLSATGVFSSHQLNIVEKGRETKGVVMTSKPTEETVGRRRVWELEVAVEREEGDGYRARARQPVLPEQEEYMLPGALVKVHYLPDTEDDIVVAYFTDDENGGVAR